VSCQPARSPCGSCPYRLDVPSGVWSAEEYAKLPGYDEPTWGQPTGVFYCHQQDGRVCAGWAGTHDMEENLGLRLAVAAGFVSVEDFDAIRDYESPVPLFESGRAAADHGLAELERPGEKAVRTIQRLERKRGR
jgi:hypothetical protein